MTIAPSLRLQVKRLKKELSAESALDIAQALRVARQSNQGRRQTHERYIAALTEPDASPHSFAEEIQQARRRVGRHVLSPGRSGTPAEHFSGEI